MVLMSMLMTNLDYCKKGNCFNLVGWSWKSWVWGGWAHLHAQHTLTHVYILHACALKWQQNLQNCWIIDMLDSICKFREWQNSANVTTVTIYHHVQWNKHHKAHTYMTYKLDVNVNLSRSHDCKGPIFYFTKQILPTATCVQSHGTEYRWEACKRWPYTWTPSTCQPAVSLPLKTGPSGSWPGRGREGAGLTAVLRGCKSKAPHTASARDTV